MIYNLKIIIKFIEFLVCIKQLQMLISALVTDLVTRIIWIPLMHITLCLTQESGKMVTNYLYIINFLF